MENRVPASPPDVVVHRVLPVGRHRSLDDYVDAGGGAGRRVALDTDAARLIDIITQSGLRGRGGAGFPTGIKWSTVAGLASDALPTTVVVNGAEGEPGTFKDRAILRANPYAVLEGALIAARAVGAPTAVIALKATFVPEIERVEAAIAEMEAAGWVDRGVLSVFRGPREYLYGEETALLESVAGRPPFPRIAPPWRRGATDVVVDVDDAVSESGLAAPVLMAGTTEAPPALVNNVETIANVPAIIANGADWFRSLGTEQSPGTIVCTVSGSTQRAGVAEIPMGTPVRRRHRDDWRRRRRRSPRAGRLAWRRQRRADRRSTRHAVDPRSDGRGREWTGLRRPDRACRRRRSARRRGGRRPLPRRRVVWAVHAVQARRARPGGAIARDVRREHRGGRRGDDHRSARHRRRWCEVCPRHAAAERRRQSGRPRRAAAPSRRFSGRRHRAARAAVHCRTCRHRRRQACLRRGVHEQAAGLDVRRDRFRSVARRSPHRQARRLATHRRWPLLGGPRIGFGILGAAM